MACYAIGHITITNMEGYKTYAAKVPAVVAQYGGEYLVRAGQYTTVEGNIPHDRHVVIKWPSREVAETWYNSDDYQAIIGHRLNNSTGDMILVDGFEG